MLDVIGRMPESYHEYTEREAEDARREERMEREVRFLPEEFLLFRPVQPLDETQIREAMRSVDD